MLIFNKLVVKQLTSFLAVFFIFYSHFVTGAFQFINEQVIEHHFKFNNISVGGLSGLYYDPYKRTFLALSDDKGRQGPPRFYELKLHKAFFEKSSQTHYQLSIEKQRFLLDKTGRSFSIDPEGIFTLPRQIFISTEGHQLKAGETKKDFQMRPPALLTFDLDGLLQYSWPLPAMFWPENLKQITHWGVKANKGFEALSLDPNNKYFWIAVESSLRQDDCLQTTNFCHFKKIIQKPQAATSRRFYSCGQQYIRMSQWDINRKKMLKQVAYPMTKFIKVQNDLPAKKMLLKGEVGLTDFAYLGEEQFLIIERSYLKNNYRSKYTTGHNKKADAYYVQLVLADCSSASDVSSYDSLHKKTFTPCKRIHTVDLQSLLRSAHIQVDNIEGIAFGPKLSKNSQLLVLVSDNNFNSTQKTQFLFFKYTPSRRILRK